MTFHFTDPTGDHVEVRPIRLATPRGPIPAVALEPEGSWFYVAADRVEEFIAGVRDTARQAPRDGEQPQPPASAQPSDRPRLFHLQRDHDVSGVSGTGRVADGVLWPDGTVSLRWIGARPSVVFWDRLEDAEHVHGHGGATRIVWTDQARAADVQAGQPQPDRGELWSLLDWTFWGSGMGDVFREPLADTMLTAITPEQRAQAEQLMEAWHASGREPLGRRRYEELNGELKTAQAARDEVLRIVSEVTTEANDSGGVDINDLVTRLQQAGFQLPDDES